VVSISISIRRRRDAAVEVRQPLSQTVDLDSSVIIMYVISVPID